jgi:hypothetical protein
MLRPADCLFDAGKGSNKYSEAAAAPLKIQRENSERSVQARPAATTHRRGRAIASGANCIEKFANRRNSHCVTMALFEHAKLANLLMCKAFHSSLGSANDFN